MKKNNILGINFDVVTKETAMAKVKEFLKDDSCNVIVTPNPEMVQNSLENSQLAMALKHADLTIPDGIGIVYASKMLGLDIKERVPGVELMEEILNHLARTNGTAYLLGAGKGVAKLASENITTKFSGIKILGYRNGYFKPEEESQIIDEINKLSPDVLFVALGSPKQEIFINKYRKHLNVKVAMGVGGSVDVFAGVVKRAPEITQKLHMEWLYRAVKEPKRFVRLGKIPKFLVQVIKSK